MKQYITLLSIILIITSCDVVEGPYMSDITIPIDTTTTDTTTNTYLQKILIEDFTGHKCPNCPDAAIELGEISAIYPGQIIGMAIHVGSFAKPTPIIGAPYDYDFRTNSGDLVDDAFGNISDALPRGMVNRAGYPEDSHKLGVGEWAATVANELTKDTTFTIDISSDESSISITSEVHKNINGDYNLVVCLTESNIINWQQDGGNSVEDYEHNHVLRTGLIDQELSISTNYVAGQEIENTITYDLIALEQSNKDYSISLGGNDIPGEWNPNNMSVVAYIYNTITKEIVQVEEAHLTN